MHFLWLCTLLTFNVISGLKYINERRIETLGLGGGSESLSAENLGALDTAHVVLVTTQTCGETCAKFEASLDGMQETVTKDIAEELGRNVTFHKTEIAKPNVENFRKKLGVASLPTTILVRGPWVYDYQGDLVSSKIKDFIRTRVSDVLEKFDDLSKVKKWLKKVEPGDVKIMITTGEAGAQNFELVAGGEREFAKYGFLRKGGDMNMKGSIDIVKWTKHIQEDDVDFSDHKKVFQLLMKEQTPSLGMIDMSRMRYYFMSQKSFAWIVHGGQLKSQFLNAIKPLIKDHNERFNFIHVDPVAAPDYVDFVREVLKLDEQDFVTSSERLQTDSSLAIVVTDLNGPGRYTFTARSNTNIQTSDLKAWFKAALEAKLPRELASEPIPQNDDERMSKVGFPKIVADEFRKLFLEGPRDRSYLVIIPSLLCNGDVCEKALQAMLEYHTSLDNRRKEVNKCGPVEVRFVDGHRNEFDPSWHFDLTASPPVWLIRKDRSPQHTDMSMLEKQLVPGVAFDSVDTLAKWLDTACARSQPKELEVQVSAKSARKPVPTDPAAKSEL